MMMFNTGFVVNLWLVADADCARNTKMIGYTRYSLQSQASLDFKWTKLNLQVRYSFCVFEQLLDLHNATEENGEVRNRIRDESDAGPACQL